MKAIGLWDAMRFTCPNPLSFICTKKPDGKTNIATVAWWSTLAVEPEILGFSMNNRSYTYEILQKTKKLVLVTPGIGLEKAAIGCGNTSGRDTDKVEKFKIEMKQMPGSDIAIPVHSVLAIACSVREYVDVKAAYFFICNVEKVLHDESRQPLFCWDGYAKIAPASM